MSMKVQTSKDAHHNQQVAFVDGDNDGYNHAISNDDMKNGNAMTSSMMALLCGCMDGLRS